MILCTLFRFEAVRKREIQGKVKEKVTRTVTPQNLISQTVSEVSPDLLNVLPKWTSLERYIKVSLIRDVKASTMSMVT